MIIGLDFDNTIVSYDALFHRVALERGLIPRELPVNKTAVRDYLRAAGEEAIWTELQGEVYGARMQEAEMFPGASDFILACRENKIQLRIVSHKTLFPYLGKQYNLHAAARDWLARHGFFDPRGFGLAENDVFFELTKVAKLGRIAACGCTDFIDDLSEVLCDPAFPSGVRRYHFDPTAPRTASTLFDGAGDWLRLAELLLPEPAWRISARFIMGVGKDTTLVPLAGGANNRVFSCGESFLIKRYFADPDDPRDRFGTERAFYHYLSVCGATPTPQSLGWDVPSRVGVFSFEKGTPPRNVEGSQVDAALEFVRTLNLPQNRKEAAALAVASEACFSIDQHLATVARRIERLRLLPTEDDGSNAARTFVDQVLEPAWKEVMQQIYSHTGDKDRAVELSLSECCVSPSDFGFHNSLVREDGRIVFFDFEYAGWDDPAKLVGDFFCQPEYPVPDIFLSVFISGLRDALALPMDSEFERRCRLLLPLYQIKWSCILLNEFTATGRRRRAFSLGETAAAARRERQLGRARELLSRLRIAA